MCDRLEYASLTIFYQVFYRNSFPYSAVLCDHIGCIYLTFLHCVFSEQTWEMKIMTLPEETPELPTPSPCSVQRSGRTALS